MLAVVARVLQLLVPHFLLVLVGLAVVLEKYKNIAAEGILATPYQCNEGTPNVQLPVEQDASAIHMARLALPCTAKQEMRCHALHHASPY